MIHQNLYMSNCLQGKYCILCIHTDNQCALNLFTCLLQLGTSGALQTLRSSQKAYMPSLWCWVSHALPTSCQPTRALAHCRSLWGALSKISSSSWSSSSWCLWPSWLACSTCTHTTLEPSIILPSPRELWVKSWECLTECVTPLSHLTNNYNRCSI